MRLSEKQQETIKTVFRKHFNIEDRIWLFGSRVDDAKKGGDIDLYIETSMTNAQKVVKAEIAFVVELKTTLGDQKIDTVINAQLADAKELPIYIEARKTGVEIL